MGMVGIVGKMEFGLQRVPRYDEKCGFLSITAGTFSWKTEVYCIFKINSLSYELKRILLVNLLKDNFQRARLMTPILI